MTLDEIKQILDLVREHELSEFELEQEGVKLRVRKNQVLCLIEAMKLMNEITSEYDGEIVQVFVENGQPVQYGERLFAVRAR